MFFWPTLANASSLLPVAGSEVARHYDKLYVFLMWACLISSVLVIGGFIYLGVKHRRRSENEKTAYITHNSLLEFLWSFIPFVIFMGVFGWGWWIFSQMRTMPKDAFEVQVYAQKWSWLFEYKSGRKSSGELIVPVDTPVKLVMTSKDVLHSFYIPAFRVKQDVIPGRYTALWFHPEKVGNYQVFCTEFCGDQHSGMLAKVKVLPKQEFEQWLQNDPYKGLSVAEVGQKVYTSRCAVCHSTTDQKIVGPGFAGTFGKDRNFQDGSTLVADANYIRESVLTPNAKVVAGFQPAMPTFAGQLSEEEIMGVIEFIKSLAK